MNVQKPSIGRIVIYKTEEGVLSPAIVIGTKEETVLERGYTVDLLVHGRNESYREFDVNNGDGEGEWSWPVLIP